MGTFLRGFLLQYLSELNVVGVIIFLFVSSGNICLTICGAGMLIIILSILHRLLPRIFPPKNNKFLYVYRGKISMVSKYIDKERHKDIIMSEFEKILGEYQEIATITNIGMLELLYEQYNPRPIENQRLNLYKISKLKKGNTYTLDLSFGKAIIEYMGKEVNTSSKYKYLGIKRYTKIKKNMKKIRMFHVKLFFNSME